MPSQLTSTHMSQLPKYIAVLRPTSEDIPSYQILECFPRDNQYEVENAPWVNKKTSLVRFSLPINEHTLTEIFEIKIRNSEEPLRFWKSNHYFEYNTEIIPVVNFDNKDFLPLRYYPVKPFNDTDKDLQRIYEVYRIVLAGQQEIIRSKKNVRREQKKPTNLPTYITDLIIQDHIQKKESCPITMAEFTDPKRMTVTTCYHCFDMEALNKWQSTNDKCPVCRATL